jgi:hypothetical protein
MNNNQLLKENESLKNIVKRYGMVMEEQERTILELRARMLELCLGELLETSYDRDGMIAKLDHAQVLLSDVYHEAIKANLIEVEDQMSCADSCIGEALNALDDN